MPEKVLFVRFLIASLLGGGAAILTVHAMVEREVEVWQGLVVIGVVVGLTGTAISLASGPWFYLPLLCIILLFLIGHMARVLEVRVQEQQMLEDDVRRYREAIEFDARNAAAHAFLAAVYHKQGRLEEAIGEYEIAVELDPQDAKSRSRLKALARRLQEQPEFVRCPKCESELSAATKTCPKCGWSRAVVQGLREMRERGDFKRLLIAAIAVAFGIPVLSLLLRISIESTMTLLMLGWMVCVVFYFYWILRPM